MMRDPFRFFAGALVFTLAQRGTAPGTGTGTTLLEKAKAGGWYPLLVIGCIVVLVGIFALLVKMKRDS
jgi:hypothetical protein